MWDEIAGGTIPSLGPLGDARIDLGCRKATVPANRIQMIEEKLRSRAQLGSCPAHNAWGGMG
ncbi:MAG: hypothetical protein AAB403_16285 [Planctomycetota bacterium]